MAEFTISPNPGQLERLGKHVCPDENGVLCPECQKRMEDRTYEGVCHADVAWDAYHELLDSNSDATEEELHAAVEAALAEL
tara:strand:- start:296 stop:538 length:243 start_codon:yes stop_codon:yes gene_type:complete